MRIRLQPSTVLFTVDDGGCAAFGNADHSTTG